MSARGQGRLAQAARRLERRPSGFFGPRTVILAEAAAWGIGLRGDAATPFGPVRLIHWIVSPYADTPLGGLVEDCASCRLPTVFGAAASAIVLQPRGGRVELPPARTDRRNLVAGRRLMGVRGWDVPHDRHMAIIDVQSGEADIAGSGVSELWCPSWRLRAELEGMRLRLAVRGGDEPGYSVITS